MRQRANQLWLLFFIPGTLLVVSHLFLTRVLGITLSELTTSVMGGAGMILLVLSLLTQLRFPRRQGKRQE